MIDPAEGADRPGVPSGRVATGGTALPEARGTAPGGHGGRSGYEIAAFPDRAGEAGDGGQCPVSPGEPFRDQLVTGLGAVPGRARAPVRPAHPGLVQGPSGHPYVPTYTLSVRTP